MRGKNHPENSEIGSAEPHAPVTILYHSGAGGTKITAELLAEFLPPEFGAKAVSVHDPEAGAAASRPGFLVFCFPTYYLKPSTSMTEFIGNLPRFDPPRAAYLVATAELYTENCFRICALLLETKGIGVAGMKVIRAPGTDVTCLVPAALCGWLYRFERNFHRKLTAAAGEIASLAPLEKPETKVPAVKWYTPFTQLLQFLVLNRLDGWRDRIRVLPDRCTRCGACVAVCDRKAWAMDDGGPIHAAERCELCTGCIHACPHNAIVLIALLKDNPRLTPGLYRRFKREARELLTAPAPSGKR